MAVMLGDAVARLILDTQQFNENLANAQSAISGFGSSALSAWSSIGYSMSAIGNSMVNTITRPTIEFGKSAVNAYKEYESAFTGVKKTLDTTSDDYKQLRDLLGGDDEVFALLSRNIQDMTQETASSAEQIAKVMEWAGQLGVPIGEDAKYITDFTKVMIELGDTTNISSEEAAEALAKLMNITRTGFDETENLGSSIVHLGNNFATTEQDIVNMSTRLAAAGATAGFSTQEILALATAASSVGMRAEAGGSALSTAITMIEKILNGAVKDAETKQQELVRITGMSTEEFHKLWKEKPIEALSTFINGLHQLDEQGDSSVAALANLQMSGVRVSNVLKALALNTDLMDRALEYANVGWDENIALSREASLRYETLDSQITQTKELWKEVQRDFAELLIPTLKELLEYIKSFLDWIKGLDDSTKQLIIRVAEFAAIVGPVLVVIGNIITSITTIMSLFQGLSGAIKGGASAFSALGGEVAGTAGIVSKLGGVFSAIVAHPFIAGAVVAGIMAIIAALVDLWNNNEEFRESVTETWNSIWELLKTLWEAIKPILMLLIDIIKEIIIAIEPLVAALVEALGPAIRGLCEALKPLITFLGHVIEALLEIAGPVIVGVIQALTGLVSLIGGPLISIITGLIEFIGALIGKFFEFVDNILGPVFDGLKEFWNLCKELFEGTTKGVIDIVSNFVNKIVEFFKWLKYVLIGDPIVIDLIDGLGRIFKEGFEFIYNIVKEIIQGIVNFFKWLVENALALIKSFVDFFYNSFVNVGEAIKGLFEGIKDTVVGFAKDLIETAKNIGKDFADGILGGAKDAAEFFGNFIETAITTLKGAIGKFKEAGANLFNAFWEGLKSVWDSVANWISSALGGIQDTIQSIIDGVKNIVSSVKEAASNVKDKAKSWISGSHANGLEYVPYDGYIAELHKGERVLTRSENQQYSNGNNNGTGGDVYNFYNTQSDPYEIARQVRRTKKELAFA